MKVLPAVSLLLLAALLALPQANALMQGEPKLPASAYKLISITATGSQRYKPEQIVASTGLQIGQMVSEDDFRHATQELGDSGAFTQVSYGFQYSPAGTKVEFRVVDSPQFVPAYFDNFVWYSDADLMSKLETAVPLFNGQLPLQGNLADQLSNTLQGLVIDKNVEGRVDYLRSGTSNGPITSFLFSVTGPSIVIRNVSFSGATPEELPQLEDAAKKIAGENYLRSILKVQVAKDLLPIFLARGYLKAQFANSEAKVIPEPPNDAQPNDAPQNQVTVDVTFPVTPGKQYKLGSVQWTGNELFPAPKLQALLHGQPGQPANEVQLNQDLEAVNKLYGTRGHVAAVVHPIPHFQDATDTVSYQLQVREGDVYRMGDLDIQGLEENPTNRLSLAWQLHKGDLYDSSYPDRFVHDAILNQLITGGWNITVHETPDPKSKTVDVTVRFDPKLQP